MRTPFSTIAATARAVHVAPSKAARAVAMRHGASKPGCRGLGARSGKILGGDGEFAHLADAALDSAEFGSLSSFETNPTEDGEKAKAIELADRILADYHGKSRNPMPSCPVTKGSAEELAERVIAVYDLAKGR